ncbi:Superkiller protein 3 [Sarracenia purpurea var. burkii]
MLDGSPPRQVGSVIRFSSGPTSDNAHFLTAKMLINALKHATSNRVSEKAKRRSKAGSCAFAPAPFITLLVPPLQSTSTRSSESPQRQAHSKLKNNLTFASLSLHHETAQLYEISEARELDAQVETRRLRLDKAKKSKEALTAEVGAEIWSKSALPSIYEGILSHPAAADEERREAEAELLLYRHKLLLALPNPASTASKTAAQGPRGTAATHLSAAELKAREAAEAQEIEAKGHARDAVGEMAMGMVTIGVPDELAWKIRLDWQDSEHLTEFPAVQLRKLLELFRNKVGPPPIAGAEEGKADGEEGNSTTAALVYASRALLLAIEDPVFLQEERERKARRDIDDGASELDALALAILSRQTRHPSSHSELPPRSTSSTKTTNPLRTLQLQHSGLFRKLKGDAALSLSNVKQGLNCIMATALTHLHSPQNHLRALRYADAVSWRNPDDLEALLAKGYIKMAGEDWLQAKNLFEEVVTKYRSGIDRRGKKPIAATRAVPLQNPLLEAQGEAAWCDLQGGKLDEATEELHNFLERVDAEDVQGVTSEQRARAWWRYGQALWQRGGPSRLDPANAFSCFITALKRLPSFAPAYTSLGTYYSTITLPTWIEARSASRKLLSSMHAKPKQAYRLANGFADEREWDLVEVVCKEDHSRRGWRGRFARIESIAKDACQQECLGMAGDRLGGVAAPETTKRASSLSRSLCAPSQTTPPFGTYLVTPQELNPAPWEIRYSIADVHRQLGDYDEAIELFEGILQAHPDQVAVRVALSDAYLLNGRIQQASGYNARAGTSFVKAAQEKLLLSSKRHGICDPPGKTAADAVFEMARLAQFRPGKESEHVHHISFGDGKRTAGGRQVAGCDVGKVLMKWLPNGKMVRTHSSTWRLTFTKSLSCLMHRPTRWLGLLGTIWPSHCLHWRVLQISRLHQSRRRTGWQSKQAIGCIKQAIKAEPHKRPILAAVGQPHVRTQHQAFAACLHPRHRKQSTQPYPMEQPWLSGGISKVNRALHLAALFSERLGQHALAVERVEEASRLLEAEYEATEDQETAQKFAIAQITLGRVRLAQERAQESVELFEGALALLEEEEDVEEAEEKSVSLDKVSICLARAQAHLGAAIAHHFLKAQEQSISSFDAALDSLASLEGMKDARVSAAKTSIVVLRARCDYANGNVAEATDHLMQLLADEPDSMAAIGLLSACAIPEQDDELLDAALSEVRNYSREQLGALDPLGTIPLLQALDRFRKGEDDAAIDHHLKIHLQSPSADPQSHTQLAEALTRRSLVSRDSDEAASKVAEVRKMVEARMEDDLQARLAEAAAVLTNGSEAQHHAYENVHYVPHVSSSWADVRAYTRSNLMMCSNARQFRRPMSNVRVLGEWDLEKLGRAQPLLNRSSLCNDCYRLCLFRITTCEERVA